MNSATAYTPLESLLLFQSLATNGTDANAFIQTSELLKSSRLIQESGVYDPGRLSPDALTDVYLRLLREEIKAEQAAHQESGNASPSKKRKLQSPPPLNITDAAQHDGKLARLVERLYARYRECVVREIREDERRYAQIEKEIAEIEAGEWDDRILREDLTRANNGQPPTQEQKNKPVSVGSSPASKSQPLSVPHNQPDGLAINDVLNTPKTGSPKPQPREPSLPATNGQTTGQSHSRTPSVDRPRTHPQSQDLKWDNTFQGGFAPPYPPSSNYPQLNQSYAPYPHNHGPPRGSFPAQGLPPPQGMIPSSPSHPHQYVTLPPPNMTRGSGSPGAPLDALADMAGQQSYRPPGPHSPSMQQSPMQSPGYPPYAPPHNGRPPTGPPVNGQWVQQPYMQPYGPPQAYYPSPQHQGQRPPFPPPDQAQQKQYSSPYHQAQGPRPSPLHAVGTPRQRPRDSAPQTPAPQPLIHSTGKATKWTPVPSSNTPKIPRELPQPAWEPLSPVVAPAKATPRLIKSTEKKSEPRGRSTRRRNHSITSSITSHADELSLDESAASRLVKQESATPRAPSPSDTVNDENRRRTRKRKLSSLASPIREILPTRERGPSPAPPTHVQWTRNFPKISANTLENIGTHRNANLFAVPLKPKDAPGYHDRVLRPQDLKSIRSAIVAGAKAGNALLATMEDTGAASISLPISEDLIPPKGIVNNAQLEKELTRLFANAIMYNPDTKRGLGDSFKKPSDDKEGGRTGTEGWRVDEDKIVKDTRIMFEDVGRIVQEMRSAERRSEDISDNDRAGSAAVHGTGDEDDVDELAGEGDVGAGTYKRRRRG